MLKKFKTVQILNFSDFEIWLEFEICSDFEIWLDFKICSDFEIYSDSKFVQISIYV
jgi:hypothetical protein